MNVHKNARLRRQVEPCWRGGLRRRAAPGELIHIDIKMLGKIDGVGHRITGQHERHHRARGIGYEHLHVAIDDASRPSPFQGEGL